MLDLRQATVRHLTLNGSRRLLTVQTRRMTLCQLRQDLNDLGIRRRDRLLTDLREVACCLLTVEASKDVRVNALGEISSYGM